MAATKSATTIVVLTSARVSGTAERAKMEREVDTGGAFLPFGAAAHGAAADDERRWGARGGVAGAGSGRQRWISEANDERDWRWTLNGGGNRRYRKMDADGSNRPGPHGSRRVRRDGNGPGTVSPQQRDE